MLRERMLRTLVLALAVCAAAASEGDDGPFEWAGIFATPEREVCRAVSCEACAALLPRDLALLTPLVDAQHSTGGSRKRPAASTWTPP